MAEAAQRLMGTGPGYDTFADIGSIRTTLEIPADFAVAAAEDADDLDDDVMILGTTPQFGSTPRYPGAGGAGSVALGYNNPSMLLRQAQHARVSAAAVRLNSQGTAGTAHTVPGAHAAGPKGIPAHQHHLDEDDDNEDDEDDSSDDEMLGMSPETAETPGAYMHQLRAGEIWAARR